MGGDQLEQTARAEAGERTLGQRTGGREGRKEPEGDVPHPEEAVEDDARGALADRAHRPAHRGQAVLGGDLRLGALATELLGERTRRRVVALADAGGHDQDARCHGGEP